MTGHPFGEFAVEIGFDGDRVILGVRGEVDVLTAPTLRALMVSLVDQGHSDLVLDLGNLAFMGAAGLQVISETSLRLSTRGGVLAVRRVPASTRLVLDISGVSGLVQIEAPDADADVALGAEQVAGDHSAAVDGAGSLSSDLARVGHLGAHNDVIDRALRLVTCLTTATVGGADGVSVSLERCGKLSTVASSNDTVLQMDAHQYQTGEGPCIAAATEGRWFHIESLAQESRWPTFVPRAIEQGISSILSTPLMAADRPLGALNIYSNHERAFGSHAQELVALFATQASGILADGGADLTDEQRDKRIAQALLAREGIALAQGVLMARHHITSQEASEMLYRGARGAELSVQRFAFDIVASSRQAGGPST